MRLCAVAAVRGDCRSSPLLINVVIALGIVVVVGVAALIARRRQQTDVPTQKVFTVPAQIDRRDFISSDSDSTAPEWLVAVFTSSTCQVCADVWDKAQVIASQHVGVYKVDYESERDLHRKYGIDAVPTLVICDGDGVVQRHFLGPVSATHLWAAVATVRDPSTQPDNGHCQHP